MKINHIYAFAGLILFASGASAASVPLVVGTYNFQLNGDGGGAQATLNGVPVEIFCDDFEHDISVPSTNSANVTQLGTGAGLSETRFGEVSSSQWTSIDLTGGVAASTEDAFFNSGAGSSASARYDMVTYLVSLYDLPAGDTTSNNKIQKAIWTLMDPAAEGPVIDPSVNPTAELEQAASWYVGGGATNSFLSQFEVVSDATMRLPGDGVGVGGFQEQIVFTPAPEPRASIWMLIGVFAFGGFLMQRVRVHRAN